MGAQPQAHHAQSLSLGPQPPLATWSNIQEGDTAPGFSWHSWYLVAEGTDRL
jgi:hypothetical protein